MKMKLFTDQNISYHFPSCLCSCNQGPYQTAALLTVLYPGITTVIGKLPTLM